MARPKSASGSHQAAAGEDMQRQPSRLLSSAHAPIHPFARLRRRRPSRTSPRSACSNEMAFAYREREEIRRTVKCFFGSSCFQNGGNNRFAVQGKAIYRSLMPSCAGAYRGAAYLPGFLQIRRLNLSCLRSILNYKNAPGFPGTALFRGKIFQPPMMPLWLQTVPLPTGSISRFSPSPFDTKVVLIAVRHCLDKGARPAAARMPLFRS